MTRPPAVLPGLLLFVLMMGFPIGSRAGNPRNAYYSASNDRLFWFIQVSDIHVGTSSADSGALLNWLLTEARAVIQPSFYIATGDLTDSTNGGWLPAGPYREEWEQYRSVVAGAGMTPNDYFDLPGNHDAYSDQYFSYFLDYSIQGEAVANTQFSFVKQFSFGKYHFLGVNTAGNTGDDFSFLPPYGDPASLDTGELAFVQRELNDPAKSDSNLTLVFGHHPLFETDNPTVTYVGYGLSDFLSLLNQSRVSIYAYGHTHWTDEAFFMPDPPAYDGFLYVNTASLSKSSSDQYTIMAIDSDGLSSKAATIEQWPAVVITAPVDAALGGFNPYAYPVPAAASNPVRALVFDPNIPSVQFRVDGGAWHSMGRVSPSRPVWQGEWDASLLQGRHSIEVQASSASGVGADSISVNVSDVTGAAAEYAAFGKYAISGSKRAKAMSFIPDPEFIYQGETVVFRISVKAAGQGIPGATVRLKISGPVETTVTGTVSDSDGNVEAVWTTSMPNKRTGGTPPGAYVATIAGVEAGPQFLWDGQGDFREFLISGKRQSTAAAHSPAIPKNPGTR